MRRTTAVVLFLASLAALATSSASHADRGTTAAQTRAETAYPKHIVVILQQNHTYDAYFGAYPRGNGAHRSAPATQRDDTGRTVTGQPFENEDVTALRPAEGSEPISNGTQAARAAYAEGAMDGFVTAQSRRGFAPDLAMRYWTREQVPGLWGIADRGVLFDAYFSSAMGGSLVNMLYLMAGDAHGHVEGTKPTLAQLADAPIPTLFDQLVDDDRSWRFYVGRLPQIEGERVVDGSYLRPDVVTPSALYWAPILAMKRFWTDPERRSSLDDQEQFFRDAANGRLPEVSFVLPLPTDHPVQLPQVHDRRLLSLVNAISKGPDWKDTLTFVVWDDWGGLYDHVAPPQVDALGYGFRVPALLLSPYANAGSVSSRVYDHTSVLHYIERRLSLPALGTRTARPDDFEEALDLSQRPRREVIRLAELPTPSVGTESQNRALLLLYGAGLAAAGFVLVLSTRAARRRGPVSDERVS